MELLEHTVGVPLLETTPALGGIILTPAGAKFTQEVMPVLDLLDRTSGDAQSHLRARNLKKCHETETPAA